MTLMDSISSNFISTTWLFSCLVFLETDHLELFGLVLDLLEHGRPPGYLDRFALGRIYCPKPHRFPKISFFSYFCLIYMYVVLLRLERVNCDEIVQVLNLFAL